MQHETGDTITTKDKSVHCLDCGVEYETLGLDMVLPDQQWKGICPENGILCANCICKRARKFGGTDVLAWVDSIDYSLVSGHWQQQWNNNTK